MIYEFHVEPMGAPRQTRADTWKKRPVVLRYRKMKDEIRKQAGEQKYQLGDVLDCIFYIPMPPSWSKKKRAEMDGQPHQQKPDTDNLLKGFMDAFRKEDCQVYDVHGIKLWAIEPKIVVYD